MSLDFNPSTLTIEERLAECRRIIKILSEIDPENLTTRESDFVAQMSDAMGCSPAQLQWLRGIKDKYL